MMKILVGFEGSKASIAALKLAAEHVQAFDAQLLLVKSMVGGPEVPKKDFENAESELEYQKSRLKDKNIACESLLSVRGLEPGEDLVRLAEEQQVRTYLKKPLSVDPIKEFLLDMKLLRI
jgi:nucleotide-binding universal stress UspA family protein